jgi:UDP-glucose 4-epimerase
MYGEATEFPTTETCTPRPLSPYAITKTVSENYLAFYNHQYGLDYTVLRYANVYGPRQIPHGEAGVVAIFMDSLISGKPCTLYSFDDEPRGMTRDYCFVGDVVRASIEALTRGSREAFNIGTGRATHTLDLFNSIYRVLASRLPDMAPELGELKRAVARAGDLTRSCLNVDKAAEGLGWRAEVGLTDGIEKTVEWRLGQETE